MDVCHDGNGAGITDLREHGQGFPPRNSHASYLASRLSQTLHLLYIGPGITLWSTEHGLNGYGSASPYRHAADHHRARLLVRSGSAHLQLSSVRSLILAVALRYLNASQQGEVRQPPRMNRWMS
jgi:hypothetical protein